MNNISLAVLQYIPVAFASLPATQITPNSTSEQYIIAANTSEEEDLCQRQRIRSSTYYSFSVISLAIIIIGGSLIIFLCSVTPVIVRSWTRSGKCSWIQEWALNNILQLHRIALEGHGLGPWDADGEVPILTGNTKRFKLPWLAETRANQMSNQDQASN